MYSPDLGFYITYCYDKGYWHENVVDDCIPCTWNIEEKEFQPLFIKPLNLGIGPLVLEKTWAKRNKSYMYWKKCKENQAKDILLYLTGFHSEEISVVNPKSKNNPRVEE